MVFTGDGKGKSTAAFGTALRMLGRGKPVAIVQFIKGDWKTGESEAFKVFGDHVTFKSMGKGFTWDTKNFEDDAKTAQDAWSQCLKFLNDSRHSLVIFDEINCAIDYNFLDVSEVVRSLRGRPANKHVICTGRNAAPELIKIADLVTEMKNVKHPFDRGIIAQAGIDY